MNAVDIIDEARINELEAERDALAQRLEKALVEGAKRREERDALLAARTKLDALEAAGVDNWSGYDDAMAQLEAG